MLLDHWLKCVVKSFSKPLSHVQYRKIASSNSLLPLKLSFENIILFLSCHIVQVKASHHNCHLLILMPSDKTYECWMKCCCGFCGKAPWIFSHVMDSHQIGWILLQWINKCVVSSCWLLQKGQDRLWICTCHLCRFFLVGSLSQSNLQANTATLGGILSFIVWPHIHLNIILFHNISIV